MIKMPNLFLYCSDYKPDRHLHKFSPDEFDYIIIDETHRAGAMTYQRVIEYFNPQFLLA